MNDSAASSSCHTSSQIVTSTRILITLCALTIIFGVVYSTNLGDRFLFADEKEYYGLAGNLASMQRYTYSGQHPSVYRPPGYPLILSVLRLFGAELVHLRILNYVFLSGCMLLAYRMLKKRASGRAGTIAAIIIFCYPVLLYTAGTLYPTILASFLLLTTLHILTQPDLSAKNSIFAGLLFGFLILTIPSFVFALGVILIWLWFTQKKSRAKVVSLTLLAAALICSIWITRNYIVFRSFVFISANGGLNLILGNSEYTKPNSGYDVDISAYYRNTLKMNDIERDDYYKKKAIEYVLNHKAQSIKLYALKALNYFNFTSGTDTSILKNQSANILMLVTYGPILTLFILRLASFRRRPLTPFEWILVILYLSNALFSAIFFTRIRFRLPYDFLIILVVALYLDSFLLSRRKRTFNN